MPELNPVYLRLTALRLAKRRHQDHEANVDRLMRRFATIADRMREHDVGDVKNMSLAEQLVKHALDASDNGADVGAFWSTLRLGFRAYLDQNPIEARRTNGHRVGVVHIDDMAQGFQSGG